MPDKMRTLRRAAAVVAAVALAAGLTGVASPAPAAVGPAAPVPAAAGKANVEDRVAVTRGGGMTFKWWFTRIDNGSGPVEIIPFAIDVCGVNVGEAAIPRFNAEYGGQTWGPTNVPNSNEGCSTYVVDPTSRVKIGYLPSGIARTHIVVNSTQGAGYWSWSVTGSTGQLAPTVRPVPSDALHQDFVSQTPAASKRSPWSCDKKPWVSKSKHLVRFRCDSGEPEAYVLKAWFCWPGGGCGWKHGRSTEYGDVAQVKAKHGDHIGGWAVYAVAPV